MSLPFKAVSAVRYEGPRKTSAGQSTASAPHNLVADDGKTYVVKFIRDCSTNRTLVNEFVCGLIAKTLGISAPDIVLINVPETIVTNSPELVAVGVTPGTYLGSQEVSGAFDLNKMPAAPDVMSATIENLDDAPGAITFDIFVWNGDRNNAGNILLQPVVGGTQFRFYLIDHGHCFTGPNWQDAQLPGYAPQAYSGPTHPLLTNCSAKAAKANTTVGEIEKMKEEVLSQMTKAVPNEWNFPNSSRSALESYLVQRRQYVRRDAAGMKVLL